MAPNLMGKIFPYHQLLRFQLYGISIMYRNIKKWLVWMIPFAIEGDFVLYLNDIGGKALNACMQNLRMMY